MGDSGYQKYFEAMSGCSTMENPDFRIIDANDRSHPRFQALLEKHRDDVEH